ncbi:YggS family pyridoxal phosphate-dependent enzyme [Heyndrickxia oleronia]|uniref:Pyridoxal phosphate homeostasis protein n=1 Tax=Heyndrickxia oleronia TaxID=38875 RepID=A0AAW6SSE4_9BACI|nr:YggS family pyridoxal phosphate-dependent enzyme [Heyndrickxia oleronia]MDH5161113.1 YggS family pyridoxal phosphate-dependent enzyme [Heyndrickxia oleronia]
MKVVENLSIINEKIKAACERSNRNSEEIKLIAVTKYVTTERAQEALQAGVKNLGENRDEGLLNKWETIGNDAVWHFIGSLQTRKVKNIIDKVSFIHSLDRLSLAEEINKRANKPISCFVQVNVSGEESKHGISPENVVNFIHDLKNFENIKVIGLMTMAPLTENVEIIRQSFRGLKELQIKIQELKLDYAPCNELSMGMSNDYTIAIEEGATYIRIGTSLVGDEG